MAVDFFEFIIDPELVQRTSGVTIFVSDKDYPDVLSSVEQIAAELPLARLVTLPRLGHFTRESMRTERFPQLLAACLGAK